MAERMVIVLPCGHLVDDIPLNLTKIVECPVGHRWEIKKTRYEVEVRNVK